jgi:hypothetical protein
MTTESTSSIATRFLGNPAGFNLPQIIAARWLARENQLPLNTQKHSRV